MSLILPAITRSGTVQRTEFSAKAAALPKGPLAPEATQFVAGPCNAGIPAVAHALVQALQPPMVAAPTIDWIDRDPGFRAGVFEVPVQWLQPASSVSPSVRAFRRWARAHVAQPDARSRLMQKRAHSAEHCMPTGLFDALLDEEHGAIDIEPLSRLEAFVLGTHLKIRGHDAYAEFAAKIYRKGESLRVFVVSSADASAHFESSPLNRAEAEALRDGWKLRAHLHSHPFNPANEFGDLGGTPAPSGPDLRAYVQLLAAGASEAWISNGFETLRLRLSGDFLDALMAADGGDVHRPDCQRWPKRSGQERRGGD